MSLRSGLAYRRAVYRWAAVLSWMGAIFYSSGRPDPLAFAGSLEETVSLDPFLHASEYLGLALLLHLALSATEHDRETSTFGPLWLAVALSLAYAMSDELHQEFVPGRGFAMIDLGYDALGTAAAFALVCLGIALRGRATARSQRRSARHSRSVT